MLLARSSCRLGHVRLGYVRLGQGQPRLQKYLEYLPSLRNLEGNGSKRHPILGYNTSFHCTYVCLFLSNTTLDIDRVHKPYKILYLKTALLLQRRVQGRVLLHMRTETPFLSRLSPVPSFPAYTGPYSVGTQDVEIPTSELHSPALAPHSQISTISFRLFYPCEPEQRKSNPVFWLPEPQGEYLRAYYRFLSAAPWLASLLRYHKPTFRVEDGDVLTLL